MLDGKPRAPKPSKDPAAVALKVDIESCNIHVLIVETKADLIPIKGPISYDILHIDSLSKIFYLDLPTQSLSPDSSSPALTVPEGSLSAPLSSPPIHVQCL